MLGYQQLLVQNTRDQLKKDQNKQNLEEMRQKKRHDNEVELDQNSELKQILAKETAINSQLRFI